MVLVIRLIFIKMSDKKEGQATSIIYTSYDTDEQEMKNLTTYLVLR